MDLWSRHAVSAMVTMHFEKYNVEQEKHCSPFKSAMVVPVILGLISDNPGCTNKTLQGYLKAYGKEYALTELILQEAFDRKV